MEKIINDCPIISSKNNTNYSLIEAAVTHIKQSGQERINAIWLEASGCSGNIISLLNSDAPDVYYLLDKMINLKFSNSLMSLEGEKAFESFLDTLETKFVLIVEGAVSTKDNGKYNIIARYNGRAISAMEAIEMAGQRAEYIIAAGTCASYGGISAASPNPGMNKSVDEFLKKEVIKVPGCPSHPDWVIGTIAHIILIGKPGLDSKGRPLIFYGITIHDNCPRRSYFDKGIFSKKIGDKECMLKLGCRGPVTKTDCPTRKWNNYVNWPIGNNATCIGCAQEKFPDGMEPFIK